ncbi:MAG TPA: hypothetical protein VHX88_04820 [Solirubrobacteraceae bacterium]|jgi:hypothetical protein|nr:hypothetical protein [Solirubrobacteraceae bacterium]
MRRPRPLSACALATAALLGLPALALGTGIHPPQGARRSDDFRLRVTDNSGLAGVGSTVTVSVVVTNQSRKRELVGLYATSPPGTSYVSCAGLCPAPSGGYFQTSRRVVRPGDQERYAVSLKVTPTASSTICEHVTAEVGARAVRDATKSVCFLIAGVPYY